MAVRGDPLRDRDSQPAHIAVDHRTGLVVRRAKMEDLSVMGECLSSVACSDQASITESIDGADDSCRLLHVFLNSAFTEMRIQIKNLVWLHDKDVLSSLGIPDVLV